MAKSSSSFKLSSVPRLIFRLSAYPLLFYILIVYFNAKSDDPEGFQDILNVFTFSKTGKDCLSARSLKNGLDSGDFEERFEEDEHSWLPSYAETDQNDNSVASLIDDILIQRQKLITESIRCHQLESTLEITQSQCFKDFSFHERILNEEVARNARIYSIVFLDAFKKVHQLLKDFKYDAEYEEFIKDSQEEEIATSTVENVKDDSIDYLNDFEIKIREIQTATLSKLSKNQQEILNHQQQEAHQENNTFENHFCEVSEDVYNRVLGFVNSNYQLLKDLGVQIDPKNIEKLPKHLINNMKATNQKK